MNRRRFAQSLMALAAVPAFPRLMAAQDAQTILSGDDPMAAAEFLSELECQTHVPALWTLYSYLHPDSQAHSPRYAVVGWYREDFQSRGPSPAVATDVTYLDSWTWDVSGSNYADVAEVSYTQEFADGTTEEDVVRLVKHEGVWAWFFGRDAEFVAEQNSRFDQTEQVAESGDAPLGLAEVDTLDPTVLEAMHLQPIVLPDGTEATPQMEEHAAELEEWQANSHRLSYLSPEGYAVAGIEFMESAEELVPGEFLATFLFELQSNRMMELVEWNTAPETGLPWARYTELGDGAVGNMDIIALVNEAGVVRMYGMPDLTELVVEQFLAAR